MPSAFETWVKEFSGPAMSDQKNYAVRWNADDPIETPRGIRDSAVAVSTLKAAVAQTIALLEEGIDPDSTLHAAQQPLVDEQPTDHGARPEDQQDVDRVAADHIAERDPGLVGRRGVHAHRCCSF